MIEEGKRGGGDVEGCMNEEILSFVIFSFFAVSFVSFLSRISSVGNEGMNE